MITFETARLLKESGFEYLGSQVYYDYEGNKIYAKDFPEDVKTISEAEERYIPIPPTDELFWGLGDDLLALGHPDQQKWESVERVEKRDRPPKMAAGSSPEEALAGLYIAIHG